MQILACRRARACRQSKYAICWPSWADARSIRYARTETTVYGKKSCSVNLLPILKFRCIQLLARLLRWNTDSRMSRNTHHTCTVSRCPPSTVTHRHSQCTPSNKPRETRSTSQSQKLRIELETLERAHRPNRISFDCSSQIFNGLDRIFMNKNPTKNERVYS